MNKNNNKIIKEAIFLILEMNYNKYMTFENGYNNEDYEPIKEENIESIEPNKEDINIPAYRDNEIIQLEDDEFIEDIDFIQDYNESLFSLEEITKLTNHNLKIKTTDKIHYKIEKILPKIIGTKEDILRITNTIINLNSMLDKDEKIQSISNIESYMTKIQIKKIITVKEFKEIYGYSAEWQKNRRGRIHHGLPYIQTVEGGKITYNVKDIENWFDNENKSNN